VLTGKIPRTQATEKVIVDTRLEMSDNPDLKETEERSLVRAIPAREVAESLIALLDGHV
jgi:hypothetical protein